MSPAVQQLTSSSTFCFAIRSASGSASSINDIGLLRTLKASISLWPMRKKIYNH